MSPPLIRRVPRAVCSQKYISAVAADLTAGDRNSRLNIQHSADTIVIIPVPGDLPVRHHKLVAGHQFVLYAGTKKLVKRKEFEEYKS